MAAPEFGEQEAQEYEWPAGVCVHNSQSVPAAATCIWNICCATARLDHVKNFCVGSRDRLMWARGELDPLARRSEPALVDVGTLNTYGTEVSHGKTGQEGKSGKGCT